MSEWKSRMQTIKIRPAEDEDSFVYHMIKTTRCSNISKKLLQKILFVFRWQSEMLSKIGFNIKILILVLVQVLDYLYKIVFMYLVNKINI